MYFDLHHAHAQEHSNQRLRPPVETDIPQQGNRQEAYAPVRQR